MPNDFDETGIDVVGLSATRDQELERAVDWLRSMVTSTGERKLSFENFCALLSQTPAPAIRSLNDKWMSNVQNLAWLGLTDALITYTKRREEEKWA